MVFSEQECLLHKHWDPSSNLWHPHKNLSGHGNPHTVGDGHSRASISTPNILLCIHTLCPSTHIYVHTAHIPAPQHAHTKSLHVFWTIIFWEANHHGVRMCMGARMRLCGPEVSIRLTGLVRLCCLSAEPQGSACFLLVPVSACEMCLCQAFLWVSWAWNSDPTAWAGSTFLSDPSP